MVSHTDFTIDVRSFGRDNTINDVAHGGVGAGAACPVMLKVTVGVIVPEVVAINELEELEVLGSCFSSTRGSFR
jgi:hypothetical protein